MIRGLVTFEKDKLIHSSKMVVPFLVFFLYLKFENSSGPQSVLAQFSISSLVIFMIMISIGMIYNDINTPMIDEAVMIKLEKRTYFYLAKVSMIIYLALILSVMGIIVPILYSSQFQPGIQPLDIISGLILLTLAGVNGGMTGLLCNRHLIAKRESGLLAVILIGLLTVVEVPLNKEFAFAKFFTWVLAPISKISVAYCKDLSFNLGNVGVLYIWLILHSLLLICLYLYLMTKKGRN